MRRLMACDLCGKKVAAHTCQNCGASVCEDHYNPRLGMCTNCPSR